MTGNLVNQPPIGQPPVASALSARPFRIPGGGELGGLIRTHDWANTPLGPLEQWPQSLRTATSVVLYSAFPTILLWGRELVQIYNDRYRLLMGGKHPSGLGQPNRECWPEAWHINETIYPRVFAGETISFDEARYPLAPNGVLEDYFLTLSYSPVFDESGGVGGVLVTVFDVTAEVRAREERDRALAEARAGRERLVDVFMQAPAAIAVLEGPRHHFTVANPRYRELVGGRDVVGRDLLDALPEIGDQGFDKLLDQVRATGEAYVASEAVVRLDRRRDGTLEDVYLDFVYQPLKEPDGTVFGVMAHAVDVTEQVHSRRRIEQLAAERRAILDQIADVVVMIDRDARISFANEASRAMYPGLETGRTFAEQVTGLRMLTLAGAPIPQDQLPSARALRGERVLDEEWIVEHPDGRRLHVQGSAVPVVTEAGPVGVVVTARDVTEPRLLQRRVELERNRLRDVFREAPAAIAVTEGPRHVFVTANQIFRRLVSVQRAIDGLPVREALPELEGQGFFEILDEVFASGEPYVGSELLARFDRHGDGTLADGYFNFVYQPVRDEDDAVRGIMIHAVEVTDQVLARRDVEHKAAELARLTHDLEQSNRELDQFAYVASHDLKAPLRGIANLTQWIEEDVGPQLSGDSREHMRLLQGRVHRMEALIDGILTYSRAGRVRTAPERVDTGALVGEVVELLDPGDGVVIDVADDMPVLEAERVPLQQVFLNFIGNAVKYTKAVREDVQVTIRWRPVRDTFEFSITDNGPGIPAEFHDRIWGIFQTLQPRDKVEGTGIGLSVVKKIVQSRGGEVSVESTEGQGATFRFTWPRAPRLILPPSIPEPT